MSDPDAVVALFEATVMPSMRAQIHGPQLNESERTRLIHAYDRVLAFATLSAGSHAEAQKKSYLAGMELKELLRVQEVSRWLLAYCDQEQRAQLFGIPAGEKEYNDERWTEVFKTIITYWAERLDQERVLSRIYIPDDAPLDFFAVFDQWQDYVDMNTKDVD